MGELDRESSTHRSGTAGDMHEVKDYKRAERVSTTGQRNKRQKKEQKLGDFLRALAVLF